MPAAQRGEPARPARARAHRGPDRPQRLPARRQDRPGIIYIIHIDIYISL